MRKDVKKFNVISSVLKHDITTLTTKYIRVSNALDSFGELCA